MMRDPAITFDSGIPGEEPIKVVLGRRTGVTREGNCLDVHLERMLDICCPLRLTCLIRTDGAIVEWMAEWSQGDNTYWHFASGPPSLPPTREQQESLARIWAGEAKPFGVRGSCGHPVMVYANLSHKEIEAIVGKKVYLA